MTEGQPRLPPMPVFDAFYEAGNGRAPFPWQSRLARHVGDHGSWPAEIGVPTGLGKTACLDIAVWWLASQAHLNAGERSAPTRIWWVVNRRLLVDEASKHAERLNEMLRQPGADGRSPHIQDVLSRVATRLCSLAGPQAGDPLHVIPMRGGLTLGRPPNPTQPSVIVSTIPMYGSRLLFRGFGSSRSMRPIDAALAGTDSLVLVDEAHLARHLRGLIPKLKQCTPASADALLPARRSAPQVVSLTATGDSSADDRFELDGDDLANEIVIRRLDAAKPVEVDTKPRGDTAKALHNAAMKLLSDAASPSSCVIFCNTPGMARDTQHLVEAHKLGAEAVVMLVTGRTRQTDADALRRKLLSTEEGAPAVRDGLPQRQRHFIVIATQTLEVGADLDFEYLVTEQCGVRALTQRLGRLNRLGHHAHARAVYVHRPPPKRSRSSAARDEDADRSSATDYWPVYGTEPNLVLERLGHRGFEEDTDLRPRWIADRLGEPADDPGRAPEVLPDLLWEWVKTTTPPGGEAPVEPYFSGVSDPQRSVSVLWRVFVPAAEPSHDTTGDEIDQAEATDKRLRLWPRSSHDETVEVPMGEFREALRAQAIDHVVRRSLDTDLVETVGLRDLRPADLIVLPSGVGMYDEFGWAPDSRKLVADLSIKRSGLPLDRRALERLGGKKSGEATAGILDALRALEGDEDEDPDDILARDAAEHLIALLRDCDVVGFEPDDWRSFLDALEPTPVRPPNEVPRLELRSGARSARIDQLDEMSLCRSLSPAAMELVAHGAAVGERAGELAEALGLPRPLADVIQTAGELHDVGKADRRFQRWLSPDAHFGEPGYIPRAKSDMATSRWSAARRDAGWPRGGRHEELSARLARDWLSKGTHGLDPGEQDLLLHLIVSHHGKGRPLVVPVGDGTVEQVEWTFPDGIRAGVSGDLAQTDWSQPSRFRRLNDRYGPWGLALLEAIVRQSDHEVSADKSSGTADVATARSEVQ